MTFTLRVQKNAAGFTVIKTRHEGDFSDSAGKTREKRSRQTLAEGLTYEGAATILGRAILQELHQKKFSLEISVSWTLDRVTCDYIARESTSSVES